MSDETTRLKKPWAGLTEVLAVSVILAACTQAQTASQSAANRAPVVTSAPVANIPADTSGATGKAHDNSFVIGNDDVLGVNVWKEPDISRSVPVRSDGKISLPLAGEIQAAG
jgi:polysaccharide biosynthesis/export protein